jgi:IS5 family transposase
MTAEQVVRAAIVKQMLGLSYDGLAFQIGDSIQLRGFCRLSSADAAPAKSTLQANIGAIRAETWEAMNKSLVKDARKRKVEDGRWMRTDTTVIESNIHHPLDSKLLWDGVRVLTRIMQRAHDDYGTTRTNFRRRAKRRSIAILNAGRMARRIPLYRDLLKVTWSASSNRTRTSFARTAATRTSVTRSRFRRAAAGSYSTSSSRQATPRTRRSRSGLRRGTRSSSASRPSVSHSTEDSRPRRISRV